jgi:hypothetical protein
MERRIWEADYGMIHLLSISLDSVSILHLGFPFLKPLPKGKDTELLVLFISLRRCGREANIDS